MSCFVTRSFCILVAHGCLPIGIYRSASLCSPWHGNSISLNVFSTDGPLDSCIFLWFSSKQCCRKHRYTSIFAGIAGSRNCPL